MDVRFGLCVLQGVGGVAGCRLLIMFFIYGGFCHWVPILCMCSVCDGFCSGGLS